ncbi:hypothetical protein ACTMU2_06485 [Cupriavidus basilensis]
MLHFLDRFLVFVLAECADAPVAIHARMQEILVDRGQFVPELGIEELDDLLVRLHGISFSRVWKILFSLFSHARSYCRCIFMVAVIGTTSSDTVKCPVNRHSWIRLSRMRMVLIFVAIINHA